MNAREERGLVIAALCKLNQTPDGWLVPSQSGEKIYRVNVEKQTCTCPDHTESGFKCKHLYAVEFTIKREVHPDGSVTETKTLTFTEKVKYKQDWPAYNYAQSVEKDRLQELLFDLCRGLEEPVHKGGGRRAHTVKDSIFASVFKVYGQFSSRRFSSDLRAAHERGWLSREIPGLKLPQFFENPAYTPILKGLIVLSSLPLRSVETKFAIDSSGFSTNKFERWYDHKYGVTRRTCTWVKVHVATGVKTNVVTAVRILDQDAADSPQLPDLVRTTGQNFVVEEVSADSAYASVDNFETIAGCGATGFIDFKSNTTGAAGGVFQKMFHYFQFKKEEYLKHYHLRSNVESTFSMVKRKFGDSVRSKTDTAMVNEVLCKFVCHNLCCLIQEECELGIDPIFWPEEKADGAGPDVVRFPAG